MKTILTVIIVVYYSTVASATELAQQQQTKQNISHALTVADAVTTIIGVGRGFVEANGIMGPSPDPATVIVFFVTRNTLHHIVTEQLIPTELKDAWLNTWIGAQAIVVMRNIAILR